jgi:DNA primase
MNLTLELLNQELGYNFSGGADTTVSSPFRRDSNPSFRCYITEDQGYYDFGSGKSYSPIGFIMELKQMNFGEAKDYLLNQYGVQFVDNNESVNRDLLSKVYLLVQYNPPVTDREVELSIKSYKQNPQLIDYLLNRIPDLSI